MTTNPTKRHTFRLVATICVALLVMANTMLIFGFSSESKEESGGRSREVTAFVARVLDPTFDDLSPAEQDEAIDHLHHYVRKAAHFLEFALLGCLTACFVQLLWSLLEKRLLLPLSWGLPALYCLLCAITDEVYQIFTHRGPAVGDVMIDFCGALSGVLFLHLCLWLASAIRRARQGGREGISA